MTKILIVIIFQQWEDNPAFNLFDYIGEEEHDQGSSLADDPKDQLYKNWQYNQVAFGGNADYNSFRKYYFIFLTLFTVIIDEF